jgi:hypothetical protein
MRHDSVSHSFVRDDSDAPLKGWHYGTNDIELRILPEALLYWLRFQVLTATSMMVTVFWDAVPCSLVKIGRRLRRQSPL